MAKRPANKKQVPASALAPSPIMMAAKALENRADRKKDKAYQKSLKSMGATVGGGGRANVPAAKPKWQEFKNKNLAGPPKKK